MGKFLKISSIVFIFFFIITFSANTALAADNQVTANKNESLVGQGYTADGIFYEVYKPTSPSATINSVIKVEVARRVVYYSILKDIPESISWSEKLDSYTTLTGTLYFSSATWDYKAGTTQVWYRGTLVGRV